MVSESKRFRGRSLHRAFALTLWIKAALALPELIAGVATFFVSRQSLVTFIVKATHVALAWDSHDVIVSFLLRSAHQLSVDSQRFAAFYLVAHGLIKLWLIGGLLRSKLWYFPVALAVFILFVAYQGYRYTITHSLWLLMLSGVDFVVIAMTWFEYRALRRKG